MRLWTSQRTNHRVKSSLVWLIVQRFLFFLLITFSIFFIFLLMFDEGKKENHEMADESTRELPGKKLSQ